MERPPHRCVRESAPRRPVLPGVALVVVVVVVVVVAALFTE